MNFMQQGGYFPAPHYRNTRCYWHIGGHFKPCPCHTIGHAVRSGWLVEWAMPAANYALTVDDADSAARRVRFSLFFLFWLLDQGLLAQTNHHLP